MDTSARRRMGGLRLRFLLIFGALAILPLVVVATVLGGWTFSSLEAHAVNDEAEFAEAVGQQLEAVLMERVTELRLLDETIGFGDKPPDEQQDLLRSLIAAESMYQELAVVGSNGDEIVKVAAASVVTDSDRGNHDGDAAFESALAGGTESFGPVGFDATLRQPLMSMAYPLIDRRTGEVRSVLTATVSFKPVWNLLGSLDSVDKRDIYVVNAYGVIVAHRDPTIVLRSARAPTLATSGNGPGLNDSESVVGAYTISLDAASMIVISEQPRAAALALASDSLRATYLVTALTLLGAIGAVVMVTRRVVRPIEEVAASAGRVAAGDLVHRVPVMGHGEIGELATGFNHMADRLNGLITNLEQRVSDRTAQLEEATRTQGRLISELRTVNAEMELVHERLEELMRSKDEFLGAVSHELRTPLTSVVGLAELLRDETFSPQEAAEMISEIAAEARDMADIIEDLLVAARREGGTLAVEPVAVNVAKNVRRVVDQVAAGSVDVAVVGSATALADAVRLRQIMRNLVVNAVRYGGDDVSVNISRANGQVRIEVCDDGAGLPRDQWELIFDPFQRSSNSRHNPASVGLGLSVSRTLARRMAGDLTYRYDSGKSVFALTLPSCVVTGSESTGSAPLTPVESARAPVQPP